MKKLLCLLMCLMAGIFFAGTIIAAEHAGMPVKEKHPGTRAEEHPGKMEMLSSNEIIQGIKDHINEVTQANDGYYPLTDAEEGKDLRLKLVRVHEDKVSYIKKDSAYFACTDFATDDGVSYDVDFWMKKTAEGKLEVYQTKIHKKDGNPRFTYQDDEIVAVE